MASYTRYIDESATGADDGTSEGDAWSSWAAAAAGCSAIWGTDATGQITLWAKRQGTPDTGSTRAFAPANQPNPGGWLRIEGYKTTTGDGGSDGVNNFYRIDDELNITCRYAVVRYIDADANRDQTLSVLGHNSLMHLCRARNVRAGGGYALDARNGCSIIECLGRVDVTHNETTYAARLDARSGICIGSYLQGGIFVNTNRSGGSISHNIIVPSLGAPTSEVGIELNDQDYRGLHINNNTIYGMAGDGIQLLGGFNTTNTWAISITANIIYGCGGYGINEPTTADLAVIARGNFMGNNTSGNFNNLAAPWAEENTTLTADPFTNASGGDFSLNNTAGGGALIRATTLWPNLVSVFGVTEPYWLPGAGGIDWTATGGGEEAAPTVARSRSRL